jgi:hypothetical protein
MPGLCDRAGSRRVAVGHRRAGDKPDGHGDHMELRRYADQ